MQVKRFVAVDMRRALELVRNELGPEAIILSSNRTSRGVEVLTTLDPVPPSNSSPRDIECSDDLPMASDSAWRDQAGVDKALAEEIVRAREQMLKARQPRAETPVAPVSPPVRPARTRQTSGDSATAKSTWEKLSFQPANGDPDEMQALKTELADMRQLLEEQLGRLSLSMETAGRAPQRSPLQASLWQRFIALGLAPEFIDPLLPGAGVCFDLKTAWRQALLRLVKRLPVAHRDIIDDGGVFAFVGPTGVGKTTTIGKLAARYVLKHGSDQVALVTTDTYRIAAHDQLRSLGRILNVPVRVVNDNHSLPQVLHSLRHAALVLIDTAGLRHGDAILKEQLDILRQQRRVRRYMVLSCNSQLQMMKASMHVYKNAGLHGCVLTKLDECASLGEILGLVMEHRLPVAYTTHGQDIPQDIEVARAHSMVSRAVALMKGGLSQNRSGLSIPAVSMPPTERAVENL